MCVLRGKRAAVLHAGHVLQHRAERESSLVGALPRRCRWQSAAATRAAVIVRSPMGCLSPLRAPAFNRAAEPRSLLEQSSPSERRQSAICSSLEGAKQ